MFQCQACGGTDFELMVQPGLNAEVTVHTDEQHDVRISVNGQSFVADLPFMNQFGLCPCGEIKRWAYYYPGQG
jgi:hypothetical protein